MLKRWCLTVLAVLLLVGVAESQTIEWRVDYLVRGGTSPFYGDGSYMFLLYPEYVPVYLHNVNWMFIGMDADLTTPQYQAYGVAVFPEGFPDISFPSGIDMIVVTPIVTQAAVVEPTPNTTTTPTVREKRERQPKQPKATARSRR